MGKQHKFAKAHVEVATTLTARAAAEAVVALASDSPTTGASVRLVCTDGDVLRFAVRAWKDRVESMTLHVTVRAEGGRTVVRSAIDTYTTKQQKIFVFIPIFPADMVAYPVYKAFMKRISEALTTQDPAADARILERV
jgi:hypothetical protein